MVFGTGVTLFPCSLEYDVATSCTQTHVINSPEKEGPSSSPTSAHGVSLDILKCSYSQTECLKTNHYSPSDYILEYLCSRPRVFHNNGLFHMSCLLALPLMDTRSSHCSLPPRCLRSRIRMSGNRMSGVRRNRNRNRQGAPVMRTLLLRMRLVTPPNFRLSLLLM